MKRGGEVRRGTLVCELSSGVSHKRAWLVQTLQFMSRVAELPSVTPGSLHQRLADNAIRDPNPRVRLLNLRYLVDPNTRTPPTVLALTARALLGEEDAGVRLIAARQLGVEGVPVLLGLVSDPRVATALRVDAFQTLDAGDAEIGPLIARLLGSSPPELVCAALSVVVARALNEHAAQVVECASSQHEAVRALAASALGRLSVNGGEEVLIRLLSDSSSDVQRGAAEALGVVGSVAAVELLLPLTEGLGRARLRQAARAAMGRIQSRLGDVEAGRLSLADGHGVAGAVTIADASAELGGVSLVDDLGSESGSTH